MARTISQERAKYIKEATDLENLIKMPGWKIIQDWINAEREVADSVLHSLDKNEQFDIMNAKITYNFVDKLEHLIAGVIENKYKILELLDPVEVKSKVRRKK